MSFSTPAVWEFCFVHALLVFLEGRVLDCGRNSDASWSLCRTCLAVSFGCLLDASRQNVGRSVDMVLCPRRAVRFASSFCWKQFKELRSSTGFGRYCFDRVLSVHCFGDLSQFSACPS